MGRLRAVSPHRAGSALHTPVITRGCVGCCAANGPLPVPALCDGVAACRLFCAGISPAIHDLSQHSNRVTCAFGFHWSRSGIFSACVTWVGLLHGTLACVCAAWLWACAGGMPGVVCAQRCVTSLQCSPHCGLVQGVFALAQECVLCYPTASFSQGCSRPSVQLNGPQPCAH